MFSALRILPQRSCHFHLARYTLCVNRKDFAQSQEFLSLLAVLDSSLLLGKYCWYKASTFCFILKGVHLLNLNRFSSLW